MIQFKNISKEYKHQIIISDISFTIERGELAVIIGPSGCGKSTTLKMINKLIKPTSGKIYVDGTEIKMMDEIVLRRNIGYVIQNTGLFPHMTVKENIEIIPKLKKQKKEKINKKTLELMDMIGLAPDDFLHRYPTQLSGGQQQRIGVARAFACDPDIILMDEPFSALDPITRSQLQNELVELQSKLKKTIAFVTHDMDEAIKIADKICIMNQGKIIQYDTPEEILKNPVNDFVSGFVGRYKIWTAPELIRAKDIMIQNPVCGNINMTTVRCMERMKVERVDSLLITDNQNRLLGIVKSETIRKHIQKNHVIENLMTTKFKKVLPNDSIVDILKLVHDENLSNVPVVEEDGTLQGLITKSSLVTTLSHPFIDSQE